MKKLNIFFETIKVGELNRSTDLIYSFKYTKNWLSYPQNFPLSLALPLEDKEFGNKITLSFFENLLPEGEVRKVFEKSHKLHGAYDFLYEFGKDCAGAIILTDEEVSPYKDHSNKRKEIDIKKVFQAIDKNHSVADVISNLHPGYLSLAGAQDKFPAILDKNKFYLPQDGNPTTHIVKVPIQRSGIVESVYNEFYCMKLANVIGMNVPNCILLDHKTHPLFVVERYDRFRSNGGFIHRIHQQDFCQAQGVTSESKYEAKNGPTLLENYNLIVKNVHIKKRMENARAYLDWICFNLLIGNNDTHSKNISFILKDGKIELAPFYDLLSTAIYPKLKRNFSFMIGDRDDFSRIGKNQFQLLDKNLGLKTGTFQEQMSNVNDKVLRIKDDLAEKMSVEYEGVKIFSKISQLISRRSRSLKIQKAF